MSFIPYMNTGYGPQMIIPIPITPRKIQGDVKTSEELEKKLKEYIDSRMSEISGKITALPADAASFENIKTQLKQVIKDEIKAYVCSDSNWNQSHGDAQCRLL